MSTENNKPRFVKLRFIWYHMLLGVASIIVWLAIPVIPSLFEGMFRETGKVRLIMSGWEYLITVFVAIMILGQWENIQKAEMRWQIWKMETDFTKRGLGFLLVAILLLLVNITQAFGLLTNWQESLSYTFLILFLGFTSAGWTSLFAVSLIKGIPLPHEAMNILADPEKLTQKIKETIGKELAIEQTPDTKINPDDIRTLSWKVIPESEQVQFELGRKVISRVENPKTGSVESAEKVDKERWAVLLVTTDFEGHVLGLVRRDVDDYQKQR